MNRVRYSGSSLPQEGLNYLCTEIQRLNSVLRASKSFRIKVPSEFSRNICFL